MRRMHTEQKENEREQERKEHKPYQNMWVGHILFCMAFSVYFPNDPNDSLITFEVFIFVLFFLTNPFILYTFSRIIPLLLFFWDVSHDERSEVPFALRKYSISRIVQFTAWEIMLCDCLPAEHSCRFFSLDLKMYKKKSLHLFKGN